MDHSWTSEGAAEQLAIWVCIPGNVEIELVSKLLQSQKLKVSFRSSLLFIGRNHSLELRFPKVFSVLSFISRANSAFRPSGIGKRIPNPPP